MTQSQSNQSKKTVKKTVPKIKWKGDKEYRHDKYKALPMEFKKNVSWKKNEPKITKIEHSHYFHTINSQGRKQKYTSTMGDHFHEVTTEVVDGELVAKCGPPITEKDLKTPRGVKRFKKPVQWPSINMDTGDQELLVDEHAHDMQYVNSELINPSHRNKTNEELARMNAQRESYMSQYSLAE